MSRTSPSRDGSPAAASTTGPAATGPAAISGALAASLALAASAGARAWVGSASGGRVAVVSAHGVVGFWETVPEAASILMAAAGPVATGALAGAGWLLFRRGQGRPTTWTLAGWMLFVYGAWVPVAHLVADPLLGAGDWMDAIDRFPNRGPVRASMVASGLFVAGLIWKETTRSLAFLVGNGARPVRSARGRWVAWSGWLAGSAVLAGAAWPAPEAVDAWTAALVAMVGTWPMLAAAARVGQRPVRGAPLQLRLSPLLTLAAAVAVALVLSILGPGITVAG